MENNSNNWKRHFKGSSFSINLLSVLFPGTLIYGLLKEFIGGGVLILFGIAFVLILLVGPLRELCLRWCRMVIGKRTKLNTDSRKITILLNLIFIVVFNAVSTLVAIFALTSIFSFLLP